MFNFFQRVLKEINKKFLNFFRFLNWKNIFKNVGILIVVLVMVFLGGVKNGEAFLVLDDGQDHVYCLNGNNIIDLNNKTFIDSDLCYNQSEEKINPSGTDEKNKNINTYIKKIVEENKKKFEEYYTKNTTYILKDGNYNATETKILNNLFESYKKSIDKFQSEENYYKVLKRLSDDKNYFYVENKTANSKGENAVYLTERLEQKQGLGDFIYWQQKGFVSKIFVDFLYNSSSTNQYYKDEDGNQKPIVEYFKNNKELKEKIKSTLTGKYNNENFGKICSNYKFKDDSKDSFIFNDGLLPCINNDTTLQKDLDTIFDSNKKNFTIGGYRFVFKTDSSWITSLNPLTKNPGKFAFSYEYTILENEFPKNIINEKENEINSKIEEAKPPNVNNLDKNLKENTKCNATNFGEVVSSSNCHVIAWLINGILDVLNSILEIILGWSLKFFDWITKISIYEFKNLVENTGIKEIWSSVIVVLLISLVFPLMLYLIFKSLFDNSLDPIQKILPSLLIFSVFTYFSFTIVATLIDLSNVTSIYLYKALGSGSGSDTAIGIRNAIIPNNDDLKFVNSPGDYSTILVNISYMAIILGGIVVFFKASVYIFTRALTFLIVLLFSPILLIPEGILKKIDEWKGTIQKNFMDGLFSAPLFFLIMFVAIQIASTIKKLKGVIGSPDGLPWIGQVIGSLFVLALFFFALKMIEEMSGIVGNFVMKNIQKYGGKAWNGVKKGAGALTGNALLRLKNHINNPDKKNTWITKRFGKQGTKWNALLTRSLNKNTKGAEDRRDKHVEKEWDYHKNLDEEGKNRNLKRIYNNTTHYLNGRATHITEELKKRDISASKDEVSFEDKLKINDKFKGEVDKKIINEKGDVTGAVFDVVGKHLSDELGASKDIIREMYNAGKKIDITDKNGKKQTLDVKDAVDKIKDQKISPKDRAILLKTFVANMEQHVGAESKDEDKKRIIQEVENDISTKYGKQGLDKLKELEGQTLGRIKRDPKTQDIICDANGDPQRDDTNAFNTKEIKVEIAEAKKKAEISKDPKDQKILADLKQKLEDIIKDERGADTHKENLKNKAEEKRHKDTIKTLKKINSVSKKQSSNNTKAVLGMHTDVIDRLVEINKSLIDLLKK